MSGRRANRAIHYAQGVGSVLDIVPATKGGRFVATKSPGERIGADFQRVGSALRHGMSTLNRELSQSGPRKASGASR